MVDEEAVGLVVDLTVLPQLLADGLALLPGIGEHQALPAPGVFEDIADARIGGLGCGIGGLLHRRGIHRDEFPFVSLRRGVVKVFHGKPPDLFAAVKLRNDCAPAAARCQKLSRQLGVADGGGEADAPRVAARQLTKPLDQAEGLKAPVRPQQGVDLVNDDETQVAEESRDLHVLVDHQRFQGFRGDLQNAGGLFEQFPLSRLGRVPVPAGHGNTRFLAQLV